jgi:hypothetical protein
MYQRPDPALTSLERHAEAVVLTLRDINEQLTRANDQRDHWATEVYDLLRDAKEASE